MNAVALVTELDHSIAPQPAEPSALDQSIQALTDLFGHCERLHRANIQHDPHTCVVCFEQR
jgi:hypothetical protein